MKAMSVSSQAISQALRLQMARAQAEMIKAEKEVVTGQVADRGLHLGIKTGRSVSLDRDIARLDNIKDTNALVATRLSASQNAMAQIQEAGQTFLETLTTSLTGSLEPRVLQGQATAMLATAASAANMTVGGEYIFAGTNTDVRPLEDFIAPGSPARAAFETWFDGAFGFPLGDPQTADITADDIGTFLNGLEGRMTGTEWTPAFSRASEQTITSRIALNETAQTSVTVDTIGMREVVMAAAAVLALSEAGINEDAARVLTNRAVGWMTGGLGQMTNSRAELGIVENRVSQASERLSTQVDLFKRTQRDMVGVDEYEAGTRLTSLLAQVETSYTLTARIQQLSLLKFIS